MKSRDEKGVAKQSLYIAEQYKMLRNNLQYMHKDSDIKSVIITSAIDGEGKTMTTVNLAVTMAKSGRKTLVIDCDFNNTGIHKAFNVTNEVGVMSILKKDDYSRPAILNSNIENLDILTSGMGSNQSDEIYLSGKIELLLKDLKRDYDFIILDTSSVLTASDVQIISQYVDGCVLVVKEGHADIEEVKRAKDILNKVNVKVLGAVFNKVDTRKQTVSHLYEHGQNSDIGEHDKSTFNILNYFRRRGKKVIATGRTVIVFLMFLLCVELSSTTAHAQELDLTEIISEEDNTNDEELIITSLDIEGWEDDVQLNESNSELSTRSMVGKERFVLPGSNIDLQFKTYMSPRVKAFAKFPLMAIQECPVYMTTSDKHKVTIVGDNYKEEPYCYTYYQHLWIWRPAESGIFKIVVSKKSNGKVVTERKVYVNAMNGEYLQLDSLKVDDSHANSAIKVALEPQRPSGFKNEDENKIMKITVGEPNYPGRTKTLVNYGTEVIPHNGIYSIQEQADGYLFGKGNYSIGAFIKGTRSIEFEDAKAISYKKNNTTNIELTLEADPSESENNGKYPIETVFDFEIKDITSNVSQDNLEYCFLRWDKTGKHVVQEYSSDKTYTWKGSHPGNYTIYARVRIKDDANKAAIKLPNSYEAEVAYPVVITGCSSKTINIDEVCIFPPTGVVKSHEMHYLTVKVTTNIHKKQLRYKAYAIHDGYVEKLSDYTRLNIIPFYPKSYGQYKILVLAKSKQSGSENARYEFTINVQK